MKRLLLTVLISFAWLVHLPSYGQIFANKSQNTIYVKLRENNRVRSIAPGETAIYEADFLAAPFLRRQALLDLRQTPSPEKIIISDLPSLNRIPLAQWRDKKWCIEKHNSLTFNQKTKGMIIVIRQAWLLDDPEADNFKPIPKTLYVRFRQLMKSILSWGDGKIINNSPYEVFIKKEKSADIFTLEPGKTFSGNFDAFSIPALHEDKIYKILDTINVQIDQQGAVKAFTNPILKQIQKKMGGWRDLKWLKAQHLEQIFIWDPLFDRSHVK